MKRFRRPLLLVIGFGAVAVAIVALAPRILRRADAVRRAAQTPSRLVAPGPLSRHHAKAIAADDCRACHSLAGSIPDAKCLACHEDVGNRREAKEGWHGTLEGACADCHRDHKGDTLIDLPSRSFNHLLARYPLRGAHQRVACEACHQEPAEDGGVRLAFQNRPHSGCASCHDDAHEPTLGDDCARCHQESGWTGRALRFRHVRDCSFQLAGRHATLACSACHAPTTEGGSLGSARFRATPRDCSGCHTDAHTPSLGNDCARCHSDSGWTGRELVFRHNRDAQFKLVGAHATLACSACHRPEQEGAPLASARLAGTVKTCAECHEAPHQPTLGNDCTACHGQESWTGRALRFRHQLDTSFPLTGAHQKVKCAQCHTPSADDARLGAGLLRGTARNCAACHDSPHKPAFAQDCKACHSTASWTGRATTVDHGEFPLTGGHGSVSCERCHEPRGVGKSESAALGTARFRGLSRACDTCHEDPHAGSLKPKSCADCHDIDDWHRTRFDHGKDARFALDPVHRQLECAACHQGERFRPTPTTCTGCHTDVARDLRGNPRGLKVGGPADPHDGKLSCADCHDLQAETSGKRGGAAASVARMAARCVRCHAAAYGTLHTQRTGRIADWLLAAEARAESAPDLRKQLELLRRWSAHNYVPAEKRLRELAEPR